MLAAAGRGCWASRALGCIGSGDREARKDVAGRVFALEHREKCIFGSSKELFRMK